MNPDKRSSTFSSGIDLAALIVKGFAFAHCQFLLENIIASVQFQTEICVGEALFV